MVASRLSPSGFLVLIAATLWGLSGLFVRALVANQLSPLQVVYYANGIGFLVLLASLALVARRHLVVSLWALGGILLLGGIGNGLSFVCYTSAIALTGVSLATLLTSTHPAWTTLLAARFLGEPIGRRRVVAIAAALAGSALVARVYDPAALRANLVGVLFGLGAGLTYAVYNIVGKRVLIGGTHPLTVSLYSLGGAALVLLPLQSAPLPFGVAAPAWPWLLVFVLAQILVGPIIFNLGLKSLQAGVVSLLASWELVVAVLLGVLALGESLDLPQAVGALLVAGSILSLHLTGAASGDTSPLPRC
jgi:DME family drug/metabolite transporter